MSSGYTLPKMRSGIFRFLSNPYLHLALVTLLAAALRFYHLGTWSLWYDEAFTLRDINTLVPTSIISERPSLLLSALVVRAFGASEWNARFIPALIGVITIFILYFPIRRFFGPLVAILSILFLAISPWHLYWSQNARFYTSLLLLYNLALFAFYWGIKKDRPWFLVLFLVLLGLAVRERLFALFVLPVVAGYLFLVKVLPFPKPPGLNLRNMLIIFLPGVIGAAVLTGFFVFDPNRWQLKMSWVNTNPFWIVSGVVYYVGLPLICLGAAGALILLKKKDDASLLLAPASLVPLIALVLLSLVSYTANRYAFVTLPAWVILASVAVRELFKDARFTSRMVAAAILLLLVVEPLSEDVLYYKYQNGNRDNWKAAFNYVKAHKKPGDLVAVSNIRLGDYYMQEPTLSINRLDLEDVQHTGQRIWFIEDLNVESKMPDQLKWFQANSRLVANYDVHVRARNFLMRIYLFDPSTEQVQIP